MNNQIDNSKPELNIQKVSALCHPEFKMETFRQNLCRQQAVLELIGKAQARKATATKSEYFTVFENETVRKAVVAKWDAIILRLGNYLIELTRKGVVSNG